MIWNIIHVCIGEGYEFHAKVQYMNESLTMNMWNISSCLP